MASILTDCHWRYDRPFQYFRGDDFVFHGERLASLCVMRHKRQPPTMKRRVTEVTCTLPMSRRTNTWRIFVQFTASNNFLLSLQFCKSFHSGSLTGPQRLSTTYLFTENSTKYSAYEIQGLQLLLSDTSQVCKRLIIPCCSAFPDVIPCTVG